MWSVVESFGTAVRVSARVVPMAALAAAAAVGPFMGVAHADFGVTTRFASDSTWTVYTADPASPLAQRLGSAKPVCLNQTSPSPCPSGAVIYGYYGGGQWPTIPGATWIWAPNVFGYTVPAQDQYYYFSKTFSLRGEPTAGAVDINADDFAQVYVNGTLVGQTGSTQDASVAMGDLATPKHLDLTPFLGTGPTVTITVRAQNGPGSFAGCNPCAYGQNPAGVVFRGTLSSTVTTTTP
jgi:hypothetical protein